MPYADAEAFRELRRRASEGRPLHSKRTKRRRFGTGIPPSSGILTQKSPLNMCLRDGMRKTSDSVS